VLLPRHCQAGAGARGEGTNFPAAGLGFAGHRSSRTKIALIG
jgi:hypothetical protein